MEYTNYININIDNLKNNISYIKNKYKFKYYILDVSNNAFNLGMKLIKYLENDIDYLYVNNLDDVYLIRKFNKEIPIILESLISKDNILDIINNNVILTVDNIENLKMIQEIDLFDTLNIIFNIDSTGFKGFQNKSEIKEALNIIKNIKKANLMGIKASDINETNYQEFSYTINDLLLNDLKLLIFNNELDKHKIKNSNAIKLDNSIYGINKVKSKLFKKTAKEFNQIFSIHSKITKIKKETKHKKTKFIGSIPYGYLNGMNENITKVNINNSLYNVILIKELNTLIEVNENISASEIVEISSSNNPLENYIPNNTLLYLKLVGANLPVLYDDYTLEKFHTFI